jgi:hypothetical protein
MCRSCFSPGPGAAHPFQRGEHTQRGHATDDRVVGPGRSGPRGDAWPVPSQGSPRRALPWPVASGQPRSGACAAGPHGRRRVIRGCLYVPAPLCIIARHHPAASRHSAGQPRRRGRAEPYPPDRDRAGAGVSGGHRQRPGARRSGHRRLHLVRQHPSRAGARPWLRGYRFPRGCAQPRPGDAAHRLSEIRRAEPGTQMVK